VLPTRFNGLGFGFEFADFDKGKIITLVQYGIALGCVVGVMRFHGLILTGLQKKGIKPNQHGVMHMPIGFLGGSLRLTNGGHMRFEGLT
jgi:hypothetical protein